MVSLMDRVQKTCLGWVDVAIPDVMRSGIMTHLDYLVNPYIEIIFE
jgi:hypothetical protein